MAATGTTTFVDSSFVPGITFHGIRTPSWVSRSMNSVVMLMRGGGGVRMGGVMGRCFFYGMCS